MTQTILEVPELGKIRFYDRVTPPLSRGEYMLNVNQNLGFDGSSSPATSNWKVGLGSDATLSTNHYFNITGPRWKISPLLVHSLTPPRNQQGVLLAYELPKIVFQRKTLPWENQLTGVTEEDGDGHPWLALLLLKDDEVISINKVDKDAGIPLSEVFSTAELNEINATSISDKLVDTVEVHKNRAISILPTLEELKLLAHASQVNPMDKELCGSDEDGWFSVVLGNRLATEENTEYHACVVSIEGRTSLLPTNPVHNRPPPEGGLIDEITRIDPDDINRTIDPLDDHIITENDFIPVEQLPEVEVNPILDNVDGSPPITPVMDQETLQTLELNQNNIGDETVNVENIGRGGTRVRRNFLSLFNVLLANTGGTSMAQNVTHQELRNTGGASMAQNVTHQELQIDQRRKIDVENTTPTSPLVFGQGDRELGISTAGGFIPGPPMHFVLLHHWKFKTGTGGDFEARMKDLKVRHFSGNNEGELGSVAELGHEKAAPALLGNSRVPSIIGDSYLQTEIVESDGTTKSCIYRGPCVGEQLNHEGKENPYNNSDEAKGLTVLDGESVDEISHAAAFELGRLLAMSDTRFTKLISRWRRMEYIGRSKFINAELVADNFKIGVLDEKIEQLTDQLIHASLKAEKHEASLEHVVVERVEEKYIPGTGLDPGITNPQLDLTQQQVNLRGTEGEFADPNIFRGGGTP